MNRYAHRTPSRLASIAVGLLAALLPQALPAAPAVDDVSGAQRRAAVEYLAALASGNAQAVGYAIHPSELDKLRLTLLGRLREENARGDRTLRGRLFGAATPLAEVERWTSLVFFSNLARRLVLPGGRAYEDVKGIAAVRDSGELVHVIVRGRQPRDRGATQVVETVSLLPYGKDWKAALPSELEAQVEDLMDGRRPGRMSAAGGGADGGATQGGAAAATGPGATGPSGGAAGTNTPEILAMLAAAEKALVDGRCDDYYRDYLSPNFRKTLSSRMFDALISGCRNSLGARESLIAALRIVRRASPRYEYEGNRATYDVSGQGLAYDQFVLERIERRWYVAE